MRVLSTVGCAVVLALMGCGGDASDGGGQGIGANGSGGGGGAVELPPEEELEASFREPVATGRYVWVTNPVSGRVAYIDAASLAIELVDAGHAPTHLAAVPDPADDVAIVLNVLSSDATLLRANGAGELTVESFAVPSSGNRWAISPDGRWATAWTDARRLEQPDPFDGLQDITVLDLHDRYSTSLTVGYRPVELGYDAASGRLFAVTQDGISVIALDNAEPAVIRNVALADAPLEDVSTRDVSITPDGHYALVRVDGKPSIDVFALAADIKTTIALPAPATDLDLSPDGSVAIAVVRDTSQVALLPMPDVVSDPLSMQLVTVSGATIGSVALASASSLALLYTNAVPSAALTVLDSAEPSPQPWSVLLHAPVQAVFPTDDAAHALVLHGTVDEEQGSAYAGAFSLVPLAANLPSKIVGLEQPPVSVALSPQGDRMLIATGDQTSAAYRLMVAKLPSLEVSELSLASRPIAAGIVAGARRGFVAQEHPDGRITFVDMDGGDVRTLTGFELATQVVVGSNP